MNHHACCLSNGKIQKRLHDRADQNTEIDAHAESEGEHQDQILSDLIGAFGLTDRTDKASVDPQDRNRDHDIHASVEITVDQILERCPDSQTYNCKQKNADKTQDDATVSTCDKFGSPKFEGKIISEPGALVLRR